MPQEYKELLARDHFQEGRAAFLTVQAGGLVAVDRLRLDELDQDWQDISIVHDIGVNESTVSRLAAHIRAINAKRPAAHRKNETEECEKFLECIFRSSKHFSEGATIEYQAPIGGRQFEHALPAGAAAGAVQHRDFRACELHYAPLWRMAVRARLAGFHIRAAVARPAKLTRQTLEQQANLATPGGQVGGEPPFPSHDSANVGSDTFVPRSGSPGPTLALFAEAGDELASRRGTVTTTDWSLLTVEEMGALANCGEQTGGEVCPEVGGDVAYLFDADDQGSVELLCNNCGGAAHLARVCPSPRKARSHKYMASLHLAQAERKDGRGPGPRRMPGRGQRPPFRGYSKRFQPRRSLPPGLGLPGGNPALSARSSAPSRARSAEEGEWESFEIGTSVSENASSSSSQSSSERSMAAREAPKPKPFAFSTSDDALFERGTLAIEGEERARAGIEEDRPRAAERSLERIGQGWQLSGEGSRGLRLLPLLSMGAIMAVMTAVATAYDYISRRVGCAARAQRQLRVRVLTALASPVVVYRLVIILLLLITVPLGRSSPVDTGYPVMEERALHDPRDIYGYFSSSRPGLEVCVDSGCTTTSIPEEVADEFPQRLLEANPTRKLWIADDRGLTIVKVIATELPVKGYHAEDKTEKLVNASMPVSRALVVRGMKKNMILLSPKVMLRDGVNTYLNDDNSLGRADCLLIKSSGIVIPFSPSNSSTYCIPVGVGGGERAMVGTLTRPTSVRTATAVHTGLGHVGNQRVNASNLIMDGVELRGMKHDEGSCKGCRLGNTGRLHARHKRSQSKHGDATRGFEHFGQQMDSDICTGFPPSFPHHFTAFVNFIDRFGHESFIYNLISPNSHEVASAGSALHESIKHRLVDGKIGRWKTDNGLNFLGEEVNEMAKALCRERGFQVPNDSDTLAVPERYHGVLQRMLRSSLSHAFADDPPGTGQCLWPWGAAQFNRLLYYLPTTALTPPQSPYQFMTGRTDPVDISWARTMYCDCTVTVAERDRDGKLGSRSADACHLGYDARRGCHFCFVPRLNRLSSFIVTEWREDSFTIARTITADTPCEYVDARDLEIAPVTAAMVPKRYTARAGTETRLLKVVFVFGGVEDKDTTPAILRSEGHNISLWDIATSSDHDLRKRSTQLRCKKDCQTADFVFMCPPCDTASISHWPPWRTIWEPTGRHDLKPDERAKVDDANTLYDFTGELAQMCIALDIKFLIESAASRRVGPKKCVWAKYANNGFLWDYPAIVAIAPYVMYLVYAQCAFLALWQKYTGLLVDRDSYPVAHRIFGHAQCDCASHEIVLRGYDDSGVARTRRAQKYVPLNAQAFATYIVEACGSNQEGERGDEWSETLRLQTHDSLCQEVAASASETNLHHFDISNATKTVPIQQPVDRDEYEAALERHKKGESTDRDEVILSWSVTRGVAPKVSFGTPLPPTKPAPTQHRPTVTKHPEPTNEDEIELWLEEAEGAFRVSEVGSITVPKTVEEAKESEWWPLFKKAMEEEIMGKLANRSWLVVKRPEGQHVLKSKWVFTVKYEDDGSIKLVKARFVGCGYSQIEHTDYDKVFASNLSSVAFRILVGCIADEDLETDHTDAVKAFTQADVDHLIYVEMPIGFGSNGYVLLLLKALEGIKQGAYLWFQHNRAALTKLGAVSWMNEPNLYWFPSIRTRTGVFADDMLTGYPKEYEEQYKGIKKEYSKLIKIDSYELSPVLKFTGCQFDRSREDGTITVHMERYIDQLCEDYKGQFEPCEMPYGESEKERKAFDNMESNGVKMEKGLYLQLMGKLVWPSTMVRLDVTFPVNKLCSKASDPDTLDYSRGLRVVGYLSTTRRMGLTYGGRIRIPMGLKSYPPGFVESCGLYVAHDNSFGTSARPMGGYVVMYCNAAVDWSASAVKIVPDSSHEAESAQASRATKAGIYTRQLLRNNGRKVQGPTPCFGDNKSNATTSQQIGSTARTRYYERATLLFKRAVLLLILIPYLVSTTDMIADMFTKSVDKPTFIRMRNMMMNIHGGLRSALEKSFKATTGSLRRLLGSVYSTVYDSLISEENADDA